MSEDLNMPSNVDSLPFFSNCPQHAMGIFCRVGEGEAWLIINSFLLFVPSFSIYTA